MSRRVLRPPEALRSAQILQRPAGASGQLSGAAGQAPRCCAERDNFWPEPLLEAIGDWLVLVRRRSARSRATASGVASVMATRMGRLAMLLAVDGLPAERLEQLLGEPGR